ncbi:MAG TPA: acyl carrier protein [Armatimonadota bacterium]
MTAISEDLDLKLRLKQMIVERLFLKLEPAEMVDDASLMDTYGIDSVNLFEIVVGLEDEFGISLQEQDFSIAAFATVDSIADLVEQKAGG